MASIVPPADEHLTTGWEPDLPADDTLLRQAVLVHASWSVEVARTAGKPWRSEPRWAAGRIGDRGALTNPVILRQPLTEPAEVLAEVGAMLPPSVPYFLVSPWPTPDLREYGLALLGYPPLMVRFPGPRTPAASITSTSSSTSASPSVEVRQVRDAAGLAVAERVLVEGYPMPDLEPLAPGDLLAPGILTETTRMWVAFVDGAPAAVAASHRHAGVTLVEYVATLPAARGRGAGAAVTWAATLEEPDHPAVLIASDDGRPIYDRMGFVPLMRWTAWLRPGG
ncbi:hypothetical protein [Actinopolymorpha rutila]|uniref:GNAT superfamily N-acetyltransferase n=1 Tax=Actinopolymorpha rutila TaxID=446787 RepID=A0A852ZHV5_9ACTN|nr:hypothetical protein [Actinopolymorpha rutila]NYH87866.1 GNAT superfamily N-acetyltransferase [Actinopolymorpha rutila]